MNLISVYLLLLLVISVRCLSDNNKCKPPQKPLCRQNEVWVKCARTCPPDTCESMWTRYICSQPQPPVDCKPACWCADGFLRNKDTLCIPIEECSPNSCKGDPNAEPSTSECGNPCPPTCQNGGKIPEMCTDVCLIDSCECKEGFLLDETINKCVRPENCSNREEEFTDE